MADLRRINDAGEIIMYVQNINRTKGIFQRWEVWNAWRSDIEVENQLSVKFCKVRDKLTN